MVAAEITTLESDILNEEGIQIEFEGFEFYKDTIMRIDYVLSLIDEADLSCGTKVRTSKFKSYINNLLFRKMQNLQ